MSRQIVGDVFSQMLAGLRPFFQEGVHLFQFDKQMNGVFENGRRAGKRTDRVDKIRRGIDGAAVAAVAVLVGTSALGTRSANESVCQKRVGNRVKKLSDLFLFDQPGSAQSRPDFVAEPAGLRRVRTAVVVEMNLKIGKVPQMGFAHVGN